MIVEIEEIVVKENRISLPYYEKPAAISFIRKKSSQLLPVSGLSDLLHLQAGVDIRARGVNGVQNDVSIRGSSFDQVLIMVNGMKITDPQTGHHSLNLPIDLDAIRNIEIYKGPSARVFGQNAFAGAINIITCIPENNGVSTNLSAGDYGLLSGSAGVSFGGIDFRNSLNISLSRSNGYKYNTDYKIGNLFYQSEILTNRGALMIMGGISRRAFGANGFYASPDYKDQFEAINTTLASLTYVPALKLDRLNISSRLYWRNNSDEYLFIRSDPDYYQNIHTTNVAGIDLNFTYRNRFGVSGLGLDLSGSRIVSNRLGERQRYGLTLFVDHRFIALDNKLSITPGIQAFLLSNFEDKILPGLDVGYNISANIMLYYNTAFTYRVPSFTDLYYEDPVNSSNSNLKAEYALSNEIGIKSRRLKGISTQLNLFHRLGQDMIDRVKYNNEDNWMPININSIVYRGIDASLELRLNEIVGNSSFLQYLNLSYCYINASTTEELPEFSKWEFENLRDQVSASITFEYFEGLTHSINYRFYNRINMDDYSLVDSRINWKNKNFNIYLDLSNIMSTEYRETNLVTMPGRWFSIGLGYKF